MVTACRCVEQRRRFARQKDRRDDSDVRNVGAARVRRVEHEGVAGFHLPGTLFENYANAFAHRAEMHRHVRRVRHEIALGIKDRTGEIESLLDVDRIARVRKRHAHLLCNRHEQVVEHFEQYRVGRGADGVSTLSLFGAFKYEVIVWRDNSAPFRLYDRCCNRLLDNGGAGDDVTRTQIFAIKNLCGAQGVVSESFDLGARLHACRTIWQIGR